MRRVIPFLALIAVVAGCSKQAPAPKEGTEAASPAASATPLAPGDPPPASALPGGPTGPAAKPIPAELPAVIARVNGEDISKSDFEVAVRNVEARAGSPVPASERDRVFHGVLDELIGYKLLLQESRARKMSVPETDIDARMVEVKRQFPSEDAFQKMLAERKITVQQVRSEMKSEMVVNRLIEAEIASKIAVAGDDVASFYKRNPKEFEVPERVRASHILIAVPAGADAATKTNALTKASSILKTVRGGGDFALLARENSQDPGSAANGGDLGFFQQGQMVGAFNDTAFKLGKGEVSDVVETEFGYHIIKVTDKQPSRAVTLDEARPQIEKYLQGVNRKKATEAFVQSLRAKGKIEVFI
ncbi:MAG TPA: peptidylprolyl isomerase [Vicinamibacterales bacterium]|nr:peptidylprolyl isomerase [Vicinamibacterales bacterium]